MLTLGGGELGKLVSGLPDGAGALALRGGVGERGLGCGGGLGVLVADSGLRGVAGLLRGLHPGGRGTVGLVLVGLRRRLRDLLLPQRPAPRRVAGAPRR